MPENEITSKQKSQLKWYNALAIFMLGAGSAATSATTSMINTIAKEFVGVPVETVRLVSTIPSLAALFSSMLLGPVIGKKISYRTTSIIGFTLMFLTGVLPGFTHNIYVMLALRFAFGFGIGMLAFGNAISMLTYDDVDTRTKMTAWFNVVNRIFTLVFTMGVGILGEISVKASFFVYGLLLIPLIFTIFFLKEPEKRTDAEKTSKIKIDFSFGKLSWFWLVFSPICLLFSYPRNLMISTLVAEKGWGASAIAGVLMTVYTFSGLAVNVIMPFLRKLMRRRLLSLFMLLMVIGTALISFAQNIWMMLFGMAICGIGYTGMGPLVTLYGATVTERHHMAFWSAMSNVLIRLIIVLSGYWITFCNNITHNPATGTLNVAIAWFALLAVLFFIIDPRPQKIKESDEAELAAKK